MDGADVDSNFVMSPVEAEPELIRPAEHICYLQLTPGFCLVNTLVQISALLIHLIHYVASFQQNERRKKIHRFD